MAAPVKRTEIRNYQELHLALRERAEQLGVSRLTIDDVSGLPSGYSAKLLAPVPIKRLGPLSFGLMLQALGLKLVVVEDREALARVKSRLTPRQRGMTRVKKNGRAA